MEKTKQFTFTEFHVAWASAKYFSIFKIFWL